ncbi:MAG: M23 family metallopeptidase [Myxococcales bacterium FL481]|nr:MAG: M23 family metallopeptidase [Myxococcales bacterium FL481]
MWRSRRSGSRWRGAWGWLGLLAVFAVSDPSVHAAVEPIDLQLHRELGLLEAHGELEAAQAALRRSQRALARRASITAYRGRQAARRLDAYEIAGATRQAQVRRRARALYKLSRGGLLRFVFEDRQRQLALDRPAPVEPIATARVRDALALRRVIAHELEELEVYQRAQRQARRELVSATRELAAHAVFRGYSHLHQDLLDAIDERVSSSLDERGRVRRRSVRGQRLDRSQRELLADVARERRTVRRQAARDGGPDSEFDLPPLLRPVPGAIVGEFGPYEDPDLGVAMRRNGVELAARARERVRSPATGVVVHVGPVAGFATVVIVEHENSLRSLVGRLIEVDVDVGDRVERGASLGRPAPAASSSSGRTIYYEVRVGEDPLDPKPWLRAH